MYDTPSEVAAAMRQLADQVETFQVSPIPPEDIISPPPGTNLTQVMATIAESGGIVELQPGATHPGPVYFPKRPIGAKPITLRTKNQLAQRRITEADRPQLATIAAQDADGALRFESTANIGVIAVALTMNIGTHEVVVIQDGDSILLDKILSIHPNGQKRIVRGNGTNITLIHSSLNGGAWSGQDSQAFWSREGAKHKIVDNLLMASGENILYGGDDNVSQSGADNPTDIIISNNDIMKSLAWKQVPGSVKNLLELKNASGVLISHNKFQNNWTDAQSGWSILFTPMNQDGQAPWSIVKDVIFELNYVTGVERGINLTGRGYTHVTGQSSGMIIRNNVIETPGQFLQASAELKDLLVEGNVSDNGFNTGVFYQGDICDKEGTTRPAPIAIFDLKWNGNTHRDNGYGIFADGAIGTDALNKRTQTYEFLNNQFQGLQWKYPTGTTAIDEKAFQQAKAALLARIGS